MLECIVTLSIVVSNSFLVVLYLFVSLVVSALQFLVIRSRLGWCRLSLVSVTLFDSLAMLTCVFTCFSLVVYPAVYLDSAVYAAERFRQLAISASSMLMSMSSTLQVTSSRMSCSSPRFCLLISSDIVCSTLALSTLDAMSANVFVLPAQKTRRPSKWYVNCRSSHISTTSSMSSIPDHNLFKQKHVGDESDLKMTFRPCSLGPHVAAAMMTAHASSTAIFTRALLLLSLHSPAKYRILSPSQRHPPYPPCPAASVLGMNCCVGCWGMVHRDGLHRRDLLSCSVFSTLDRHALALSDGRVHFSSVPACRTRYAGPNRHLLHTSPRTDSANPRT